MRPLALFAQDDHTLLARWRTWFGAVVFSSLIVVACATGDARADESGISFWIPGFFGSLAAAPQQPGWSLTTIYYHTDVSASGNAAVAREISIGQFNPKININVNANIHGIGALSLRPMCSRTHSSAARHPPACCSAMAATTHH